MNELHLFNNLTKKKEKFTPLDPNRVTMYVCGPTVYSHAHIGNARPPVVFDVLYRLLMITYENVVYARNITDIEDKIIDAAAKANVSIKEITDKYTEFFHNDLASLYVLPPVVEPHATDHIPEMIKMIEDLIAKGFAYAVDGHVLFDVTKYQDYGHLSGRNLEDMIAGSRVEVADYKKNPADFVLWKPSYDETPGWQSPWFSDDGRNKGMGRPGWHIECSCMAEKHLGTTIDIHGGGHDLIFPHHENEIAQSTCAHDGALFSRFWLHNGFINMEKEKMSKSLGNILLVKELLESHQGETVRMALLSTHYRKPLDWSSTTMELAKNKLDRLYRALGNATRHDGMESIFSVKKYQEYSENVFNALVDDLNTPLAIDCLLQMANQINKLEDEVEISELRNQLLIDASLLGLLNDSSENWFKSGGVDEGFSQWVEIKIDERSNARKNKDFAEADRIRDELLAKGVEIEDGAMGVSWHLKSK